MRIYICLIGLLLAGSLINTGCSKKNEEQAVDKTGAVSEKGAATEAKEAPELPNIQIGGVDKEVQIALADVLKVKGLIRHGNDYIVNINDNLVKKGQALQIVLKEQNYRVDVRSVTKNNVVLEAFKID